MGTWKLSANNKQHWHFLVKKYLFWQIIWTSLSNWHFISILRENVPWTGGLWRLESVWKTFDRNNFQCTSFGHKMASSSPGGLSLRCLWSLVVARRSSNSWSPIFGIADEPSVFQSFHSVHHFSIFSWCASEGGSTINLCTAHKRSAFRFCDGLWRYRKTDIETKTKYSSLIKFDKLHIKYYWYWHLYFILKIINNRHLVQTAKFALRCVIIWLSNIQRASFHRPLQFCQFRKADHR